MPFTASHVWSLAVAAQRINGDYLKEDEWLANATPPCRGRDANKKMVKQWLREGSNPATEADVAAAAAVRGYFNTFLMRELSGKINDFERTALRLAQKDEFTERDLYDFSVIACLPSVMTRDQQRQEIRREIYVSEQLQGQVGEEIIGSITVINSKFNQNFNKYRIAARLNESFVDFWFSKELAGELRIKGKIKAQRGDKTTQLNYVKIIG
jgi:hypothetical protein